MIMITRMKSHMVNNLKMIMMTRVKKIKMNQDLKESIMNLNKNNKSKKEKERSQTDRKIKS